MSNVERLVLSALTRSRKSEQKEALENGLCPSVFSQCAAEATWFWSHWESFQKFPDPITVKRKWPDLLVVQTPEPLTHYVEQLHERKAANAVTRALTQANKKLLLPNASAYDVLADLRQALEVVRDDRNLTTDEEWRGASKTRLQRYLDKKKEIAADYLPTPWPTMNKMILGFRPGQLISMIGRYGMGKTWMLVAIAHHLYTLGKRILIFSLEMKSDELFDRLDAVGAGLDLEKFLSGDLPPNQLVMYKKFLTDQQTSKGEVILCEDATLGGLTTEFAHAKIMKYDPDIVLVDGAYLMDLNDDALVQGMVKLSRAMKRLTKAANLPIVQVHQVSRKGEGKKMGGGHGSVAWSDAVEQDSDLLWEITGERESDQRILRGLKGRQHKVGDILINYKLSPRVDFSEHALMTPKKLWQPSKKKPAEKSVL